MITKHKEVKARIKLANKQCNKEALALIDRKVSEYIDEIIKKQTNKRITAENFQM